MKGLWPKLARFLQEGERAALITLAEVQGSSPREAGTRMLVRADGAFSGTIGGGALEWQALAEAQRLIAAFPKGVGRTQSFALGPDLGQCCGGQVLLRFEVVTKADLDWITPLVDMGDARFITSAMPDARGVLQRAIAGAEAGGIIEAFGEAHTPLLLFGAGHVGRALVLALAPLPFLVRWVDNRRDAFPSHAPANAKMIFQSDPVLEIEAAPPHSIALIMTQSHALDLALVAAGLKNPAIQRLGVIGSATKRARFLSQIKKAGFGDEALSRLICPIGLPELKGKHPAIIAAGVAVQALLWHEARTLSLQQPETERRHAPS